MKSDREKSQEIMRTIELFFKEENYNSVNDYITTYNPYMHSKKENIALIRSTYRHRDKLPEWEKLLFKLYYISNYDSSLYNETLFENLKEKCSEYYTSDEFYIFVAEYSTMSLGYCPKCGAKGVNAARNPVGPTWCENGHEYPHAQRQPTSVIPVPVKPLRIYVDMDGVIADFEEALDGGKNPKVVKLMPGTYIGLKPMTGAIEAVRKLILQGHDVVLATKIPTHNVLAATEKLHWINQYFPEMIDKVIITHDKGCLRGDILIDDRKHKANCENFEGTFIHFGTEEFPTWVEVLEYIGGLSVQ